MQGCLLGRSTVSVCTTDVAEKAHRGQCFLFVCFVCFFFGGRDRKINPAPPLVSHLGFHRRPSGCSLCNLSRRLRENHNRIIFPRTGGTTEAASLETEAEARSEVPPGCAVPPRAQQGDLTRREAGPSSKELALQGTVSRKEVG